MQYIDTGADIGGMEVIPFTLFYHDFVDTVTDFVLFNTNYVILVFGQRIAYLNIVGLPRMNKDDQYID